MVTPGEADRRRSPRSEDLRLGPALQALDQASLWVEKPVRRIAGSARLNPLPHAGTISVFLLGLVVVSGLYITLFFEYGHIASYESVRSMEDHAIQRVVRALHRYASAALVVTTVVHGWRILTARRFVGRQRRLRWATGVSAVVLVWLAGVTGYWLVWDVRAQALNELVVGFVGGTGAGAGVAIDHLGVLGSDAGRTGSGFMVTMWFSHLLLTVAIGYFVFRHLRRSNLPWLPPRHLMALMGGALVLVSLAVPVGMLDPARPDRLIGGIPIDPFVLFLLPPLLSDARWLVLAVAVVLLAVVLVLPRLLRRQDPPPIIIDDEACTGCELCVFDCPYQALTMNGSADRPLAIVDERLCVSCGICLGSCAFGAIELPGFDPSPPLRVEGRSLVIACDRHVDHGKNLDPETDAVHWVGCAGVVAPDTIRGFAEQGATDIQVVGCAPNECRYGIGNTLAAERLAGRRNPHPAAKFSRIVTQDWIPGDRFRQALTEPGSHPDADANRGPRSREKLVGAGAIAAVTVAGVALATRAPFDSGFDDAALRLVVDHEQGQALRIVPDTEPLGVLSSIEVTLDRQPLASVTPSGDGDTWRDIVDVQLPADGSASQLLVTATDGEVSTVLVDEPLDLVSGERVLIDVTDVAPTATVADGRRIFNSRRGGCDVCHSVEPGEDVVGPSLAGVASVAADRVEGLDAEQYLRQSILLPDQYIVEGWPAGQMLPIYRDRLTEQELDAVIGYLMTLQNRTETEGDS